ncbi:hypothetical protein NEDG_00268 [Nematocida displodere]|uniref:MHD domain-containing protein n=1 Tax=Nematocida displodere TaxID=1805483 RepID=A0A177EIJ8_9MICR|nr:hypothetical protein NEDG_00268 [Nematocida displodere]
MLARVEIETPDGLSLLRYQNPKLHLSASTPTFSLVEKKDGLAYKAFYLLQDDQYLAKHVLKELIRDLSVSSDSLILKKHAIVYAYIDNYLTTRNPIFSIPRKRNIPEPFQIQGLSKKKVYVEVADQIFQRTLQGRTTVTSYGQITTRPTGDVGSMSLKIDSRSLCGMKHIQFNPSVCTQREGITTLVTCPSKDMSVMAYTFSCNEADLPVVKVTLIDSKTIEVLLCFDEGHVPDSFKTSLSFDFDPGFLSVECKTGKYEYVPNTKTLLWNVSPSANTSLVIHCTEPHRSSLLFRYRYLFAKTAISSVLVKSLSSEADENWIKYTTLVTGLIKVVE